MRDIWFQRSLKNFRTFLHTLQLPQFRYLFRKFDVTISAAMRRRKVDTNLPIARDDSNSSHFLSSTWRPSLKQLLSKLPFYATLFDKKGRTSFLKYISRSKDFQPTNAESITKFHSPQQREKHVDCRQQGELGRDKLRRDMGYSLYLCANSVPLKGKNG